MEAHVITICLALLLGSSALAAKALAYVLTSDGWELVPFKPFNCWGCLAFWLTIAFGLVDGLAVVPKYDLPETQVVAAYGVAGVSILLGFVNYLWVKNKYDVED